MNDLDVARCLYDAALGEATWDDALEALSSRVDGAALFLGAGDPLDAGAFETFARGFDLSPYQGPELRPQDSWNPALNPCVAAGLIMPIGRSFDYRTYFSERAFRDSPVLRPQIEQALSRPRLFVLARESDMFSGGYIAQHGNAELDPEAARRFDAFIPHLARAVRVRHEIGRHRDIARNLHEVIERLHVGVLLLDRHLAVLVRNEAAERCLARRDALSLHRGRLRLGTTLAQRELERQIHHVAHPEGPCPDGRVISVPRRTHLLPCTLRVFPAIGTGDVGGGRGVCALVMVHDPDAPEALPDVALLASALGLTPAEAALARLVPLALSKRLMAERLGVSENTVKTQLVSIRAKAGARNVGELLRIVERLAVLADAHPQTESH